MNDFHDRSKRLNISKKILTILLQITTQKKTRSGTYSVPEAYLQRIAGQF